MHAPQTPLLLTQDQIDDAVSPETFALYHTLHYAGVLPEDESRGTLERYAALEREVAGVIDSHAPDLANILSDSVTAVSAESFAEGFRRGVAFTRWLAERPDPALLAA